MNYSCIYNRLILAMLSMIISYPIAAQTNVTIKGQVVDSDFGYELIGANVTLMTQDSVAVKSSQANKKEIVNRTIIQTSKFSMSVPKQSEQYIFKITYPGFDTLYVDYNMSDIGTRVASIDLDPFRMKRTAKELNEVVVKATMVKFYNKGDTLVYNAAAFKLADGSMLDALIRQLPDVELKSDGRIYVRGQYVENLLLNGKDFFKGKNRLLLDNLGAYTVKNVAVYDKRGETSEFLGRDVVGDQRYVMDIRLKKEYSKGWIVNLEAGAGSKERYLGRLFAMGFTDRARLSVYANVNNLNDSRKPGQIDGWTPDMIKSGVRKEVQSGIDYMVENAGHTKTATGNVNFEHSILDDFNATNRTNFFAQGNTSEQSFSSLHSKNYSIGTDHRFYMMHDKYNLTIAPLFSYRHFTNNSEVISASFSKELDLLDAETLRNILTSSNNVLKKELINRSIHNSAYKGHQAKGALNASSTVKVTGTPDFITLNANASISSDHSEKYSTWSIDYNRPTPSQSGRKQNQRNYPNHSKTFGGSAGYTFVATNLIDFGLSYGFNYTETNKNTALYFIENMSGDMSSDINYSAVFDPNNSFVSNEKVYSHIVTPTVNFTKFFNEDRLWIQIAAPINIKHRSLKYLSGDVDTLLTKNSFTPSTYDTFIKWRTGDKKHEFTIQYLLTPEDPEMIDFVDITNTTDPLNIYIGNDNLKSSLNHNIVTSWRLSLRPHSFNNYFRFIFDTTADALVKGYLYDKETGIRTYRTYNMAGNNRYDLHDSFSFNFGSSSQFALSSATSFDWINSTGMIGENVTAPIKQTVKNRLFSQTFRLEYNVAGQKLELLTDGLWRKSKSVDNDNVDFTSSDLKFGIVGTFKLPFGFGLVTDLTLYTRHGYSSAEMNRNSWVWNGRLTYSAFKGKWVFMLDGFDMLHQLKNVTYFVNAQGRTESYTNVMPRYMLFHAQYRFSISPKKNK